MIKTVIVGKNSFVTKSVKKNLKNSVILSANEINKKIINEKLKKYKKINLVFNNFYPSKFLNNLNHKNYKELCSLSLEKISIVFDNIPTHKVNKIIYSSSAAVYRLTKNLNTDKKDFFNRELYSSFKLAAEKMILNYSEKNKKSYYIMRLFNTYGNPKDKFSFVENIIKSKKNKLPIILINEGLSLRDFVHIDDVGKIYSIFLNKKINKGIYDIGTGKGYLIKDLVKTANFKKENLLKRNKIEEIKNSIADVRKLKSEIGNFKFKNVNSYLKKRLNILNKSKIIPYNKLYNNDLIPSGSVIYGAGFAGKQILQELNKINERVLYFVDDKISHQNTIINGIPVISYNNLLRLQDKNSIRRVYLAIPSLNKKKQIKILSKIKENFFDVRFLPQKKFLLSDQININDLNIDEINSILNRKQIKIKKIKKLYNKKILVTGAGGTIGSEICRQLLQQKVKKIIALDKSELAIYNLQKNLVNRKVIFNLLDINNINILEKLINNEKIDIIFHAAAYKHVNILEKNLFSAVKNNIFATNNLCALSNKYNCEMVFISTDKAANPKSILGYSKRFAEKVCENFNDKENHKKLIKIVRFGNVFGSSGSAITNFIDKINTNEPIKLTNKKATRYFMTIHEACHLVLQTTEINKKDNTFVLNMGKPLNILDLAKDLGKIKSKINPSYKFKYVEVGLQPGEKLHETIVDKKEMRKRLNNEIFVIKRKKNRTMNFGILYNSLVECYQKMNKKELTTILIKIRNF